MKKFLKYLTPYIPIIGYIITIFKDDWLEVEDKYGNKKSVLCNQFVFLSSALVQGLGCFYVFNFIL